MRGIRQILNHHPKDKNLTWPKVLRDDYLTNDADFRRGYALLQKFGFSFDLQVNPHQLKDAAAFIHNFRDTPVILDHLGCLKLSGDANHDLKQIEEWREGIRAVSQLPNVFVKLSQFYFVQMGWQVAESDANTQLKSLVRETVSLFGSDRCMFASNYPVDKNAGVLPGPMYSVFEEWSQEFNYEALFFGTATKAYRLN